MERPHTLVLQHIFSEINDRGLESDLLFLEKWEIYPLPGSAVALRISQIRRANPGLAEAIRRELSLPKQTIIELQLTLRKSV